MLHPLVQKYRRKGILVDANLLVVLLVGKLGPAHLKNCRATKANSFTPGDYSLLVQGVTKFDTLVTTPHILTEVSNLAGSLPEPLLGEFRALFRIVVKSMSEQACPAKEIAWDAQFLRFGLTDRRPQERVQDRHRQPPAPTPAQWPLALALPPQRHRRLAPY